MRYSEVVTLIPQALQDTDPDGYPQAAPTGREVFADIKSVKRSEFWTAKQSDVEIVLTVGVRVCDYKGERLLDYDGKRYRVERTFTPDGENIELNCSENKGAIL